MSPMDWLPRNSPLAVELDALQREREQVGKKVHILVQRGEEACAKVDAASEQARARAEEARNATQELGEAVVQARSQGTLLVQTRQSVADWHEQMKADAQALLISLPEMGREVARAIFDNLTERVTKIEERVQGAETRLASLTTVGQGAETRLESLTTEFKESQRNQVHLNRSLAKLWKVMVVLLVALLGVAAYWVVQSR